MYEVERKRKYIWGDEEHTSLYVPPTVDLRIVAPLLSNKDEDEDEDEHEHEHEQANRRIDLSQTRPDRYNTVQSTGVT
ncbi:hypothetical protein ACMFMF_007490 [Clarireedia jacksonii]